MMSLDKVPSGELFWSEIQGKSLFVYLCVPMYDYSAQEARRGFPIPWYGQL